MPYQIQVGAEIVEFPDSVGQDEAQRILAEQFPPTGEDVAVALQDPDFVPTQEQFGLFREYNKTKQTDWINTIAQSVDVATQMIGNAAAEGVQGAAANPLNYVEGLAQGTLQLVGLVSQSENPDSLLFRFKDLVTGTGTPESQYAQFLEARDFAKRIRQLESGQDSLVVPTDLTNPEFVTGVSMIADPTLFIPGLGEALGAGKFASKAVGKAAQMTGRGIAAAARPLERAAAGAERFVGGALNIPADTIRNTATTAGIAGALGVAPEAAVLAGIPTAVSATREVGEAIAAAGENLMTQPSRIGPLEAIGNAPGANMRQRMLGVIGQYGGDAALDTALRATAGSLEGAAIGAGLGFLAGGEEGAAAGIGMGGTLGAAGATAARTVSRLTGSAAREARAGDLQRYMDSLPEGESKRMFTEILDRNGVDIASSMMDLDGLIRGRFGDVDIQYRSNKDFSDRFGGGRGVQLEEAGRPVIYINADILGKGKGDGPLYTLGHELFHALEKSEQLGAKASDIKDSLVGRWITDGNTVTKLADGALTEAEIEARFNEYRDKLGRNAPDRADALAQYDTVEKRAGYVASEIAAEHLARLVSGQKPDTMLRGFGGLSRQLLDMALTQNASRALSRMAEGIETRFGAKPLDSVLFPDLREASPQVNAMLRDLLRSRRRLDERILMDSDGPGTVLRPQDAANPVAAKTLVDIGLAERMPDGTVRTFSDEEMRVREDADTQAIRTILEGIPGARSVDGNISGRFSPEQLSAIEQSQAVSGRMKDKIRAIDSAMRNGNSIFVDYGAATRRKLNKATGKYTSKYSSGIRLSQREVLPYSFYLSKADNPVMRVIDITKIRKSLERLTAPDGSIAGGLWDNVDGFMSDLAAYFTNLDAKESARRSAELFGEDKARFLGDFVNEQEKGGRKFVRDLRVDRVGSIDPREFRARISEDAIQMSKLRWMPSERVGDTTVTSSEEGYRIIGGAKQKLYGPDGKLLGIFDTQTQAERKADATQARLQPEDRQQQRPARDEGRQTAEAGRGDRTVGRREGQAEVGAVRQEGDVVQNFNALVEAAPDVRFMPVESQPENAPVSGRITKGQQASIDELSQYYTSKTPDRVKVLKSDAIDSLASRLINKGVPVQEANAISSKTFSKIRKGVSGALQVISGMGLSDLSRMAGTGKPTVERRPHINQNWLTSAFEAFATDEGLALMKAQQVATQLNKADQAKAAAGESVEAARASGVRQSTMQQGMEFVLGEMNADRKAFGTSLREDLDSPPRVYASVGEGQKFGGQGNYNVFFEWKKETPMVATSHHHYGVANGVTGIHAQGNIGDKNARSFGNPSAEKYDTLPSGKKVLNTHLLVGNQGVPDVRAHQLTVSIPESSLSGIRSVYKEKGIAGVEAELNRIAVSQLIGTKSQGKTKAFTSKEGIPPMVAIQKNRTEAYVLNPDLANVASVTIVSNSPKEVSLIRKNLEKAFANNGSALPKVKVVSAESGASGNVGRKAITDEYFKLTGEQRFMPSSLTARDINAIAAEVGGGDVKGGAKAFGAFMRSMRDKGITLRDVVKSYGITLSSIQRQELPVSTIKKNWPDAPFQEGTKVRPEDAFAQLLGTPEGQKYLDAAERGVFDEQAADAVVQKFRSFGFHNKLKEQMKTAVEQFYPKAQEIIDAVNTMPTDKFIDYVRNNFKGISYGKVGFWSGQLGRGDIPTFDSRQGKLVYGKEVPVTKQVLMEQKDRLTQLGIKVPAAFKDFAQTLLHHEVWDRLNQSDTEHGPIKEAMLRYMPSAAEMATGRPVPSHREAQALFDRGFRIYGAPYDGAESPILLTKAAQITQYDPENLWAVPPRGKGTPEGMRNMPSDTDYLAAVQKGDTQATQRMVEEAAKAAGYDTRGLWRSVRRNKAGSELESREQSYVTDDLEAAKQYKHGIKYALQKVYAKLGNTLEIRTKDDLKRLVPEIDISGDDYVFESLDKDPVRKKIWSLGYDSVKFTDMTPNNTIEHTAWLLKDSGTIKSSNPITRDDAGNVIPLSQRFKTDSEDIRYQPTSEQDTKALQMLPKPRRSLDAAYQDGVKTRSQDPQFYDVPDYVGFDMARTAAFEMGREGAEPPRWVMAERIGKLPEGGRSRNFSEDRMERGVSALRIVGEPQSDVGTYEMFNPGEKRYIAGWLVGLGSDGEPLLADAIDLGPVSSDVRMMPTPDSSMPGAYSFAGGFRAIPGKAKGSLRLYGPAGTLIGIASSLDEAQRIVRRKAAAR